VVRGGCESSAGMEWERAAPRYSNHGHRNGYCRAEAGKPSVSYLLQPLVEAYDFNELSLALWAS
jgi:hypothetical protein